MSTSVIKVDGMQAVEMNSQPTEINIHIHQESALAKLLQAGRSFLQSKIYFQHTLKESKRVLQAQLALGVSLILLGVLSCSFGIFLYFGPWTPLQDIGCTFWAGAVAIMAGIGAIIYEKCQSSYWGRFAALLALTSVSTALAALILCSYSLRESANYFSNPSEICERSENSNTSYYGRSRYWEIEECERNMNMLLHLFQGIQATLLAIFAVTLLLSLASLGVGLRNLCRPNSQFQVEEGVEKKLLGEESLPPSPCKEKSAGVINL
ncbi:transmembrane protein 176B-like [Trichosurus vulpecula]|uniref:transmembrane protein 176B-like n=1 Tax=Trichosurus vulpecula TaxID=9337 RepID=UPI00186AE50A|nr:transmembrane protein 176B-like [Trichosurus vulpecula]